MRTFVIAIFVALFVALSGCYFYYPRIPSTPAPTVKPGAKVEATYEGTTYERDCLASDRACHVSKKGITTTASYTTYRVTYDGKPLSPFELRQLVDPAFDKKLAHVKRNKGLCNLSLVPSVIAVAGLVVLSVAGPFYDKLGDAAVPVAVGAAGALLGGTVLSYPLGGFACKRAGREYKALFGGLPSTEREEVIVHDEQVQYLEEMETLTAAFNAKFGDGVAPTEPPADAPPEAPVETPAPIAAPAATDYKVGDAVMVEWKGSE